MKAWEIEQIRRVTNSRWAARGNRQFSGRVAIDSRLVKDGDLFIAIEGKKHDAHNYVSQVIDSRAAAILVHQDPAPDIVERAQTLGVAILRCDDTIAGLNRLAAAYRGELRAKVIAVGGSNGKTSTKRIIHTLLSEKFKGVASPKSFNNNIGMPLTLLDVEPNHEYVVLEIGTNAPGEIAALGEVCRPDVAIITSIGLEHLEKLYDLAGVAAEEASITRFIQDGGTLFMPAGVMELNEALKRCTTQCITIGLVGSGADLVADHITQSVEGLTFQLNGRAPFRLPLLGEHNAMNALIAIGVARRLGLSDEQIQAGLNKVQPAPMRLEMTRAAGHLVINDAYNANPSSVAASLETFGKLNIPGNPRKIVVLGDMLELGLQSDGLHRKIGEMVASLKFSVFIAIGPMMRYAAQVAEDRGVAVHRFDSTADAAKAVPALLEQSDAILLKGSRGMALEGILEAINPGAAVAAH